MGADVAVSAIGCWRSRRSRLSTLPLLYLVAACLAFFVGQSFFSEFFHVRRSRPAAAAAAGDPNNLRLLPTDFLRFRENCTEPTVPSEKVRPLVLDKIFDGVSPFDGFPSPEVAPLLRKKRIKGWGSRAPVFEKLMREVRPSVIVELGTFLGASAIHIGDLARNLSLKPAILCVDDYRGWPGFRAEKFTDIKLLNGNNMLFYQFMRNVQYMNLTDLILPVPFSTVGTLMNLCEWGVRSDLIEVDASHDFHSAWLDLNLAYPTLRPGGVMFGHDYYNRADGNGVRRAVDLFAKLKNLEVEPDGKHWILRSRNDSLPTIPSRRSAQ